MNNEIETTTFRYKTMEKMSQVAADYRSTGWNLDSVNPRGCTLINRYRAHQRIEMVLHGRESYTHHNGVRLW